MASDDGWNDAYTRPSCQACFGAKSWLRHTGEWMDRLPIRTDTFGLVILEAMASGVPVIATPQTGSRIGIQNGVAGFLSDDFVNDVRRLMHDPALQLAVGGAARAFALKNSWEVGF